MGYVYNSSSKFYCSFTRIHPQYYCQSFKVSTLKAFRVEDFGLLVLLWHRIQEFKVFDSGFKILDLGAWRIEFGVEFRACSFLDSFTF